MNKSGNYLSLDDNTDWQKLSRKIIAQEKMNSVQTIDFKSKREAKQFIERVAKNRGNINIPLSSK